MVLAMMQSSMQPDAMDIDIEMDIDDIPATIGERALEDGEQAAFSIANRSPTNNMTIPAIYNEDPEDEPEWRKLHLRGVDELSTQNIEVYAQENYSAEAPRIQWVDDTSANLLYSSTDHSSAAMLALCADSVTVEQLHESPFEVRKAKPTAGHTGAMLTIRIAKVRDRKVKDARHQSRYYLLHPEVDPEERIRRAKAAAGRVGDRGDYNRNRFDDREHRRRRRHDDDRKSADDFSADMYDDAPSNREPGRDLFSRITKSRRRSMSPGHRDSISLSDSETDSQGPQRRKQYRNRSDSPPRRSNRRRELFADVPTDGQGGMRSENPDFVRKALARPRLEANTAAARTLKDSLRAGQSPVSSPKHRRGKAMDTRAQEDLMERFARKSISLDSTKSVREKTANSGKELFDNDHEMEGTGFAVKGSASQGISIKGRADVKELFPERYGDERHNSGRELFDTKVRTRGPKKQAFDLFD